MGLLPLDTRLVQGDSLAFTKGLDSNSVQLIITSPPYNVGKSYETKVSIDAYLDTQTELISELVRILDLKGSICWQVGNYVDSGEVYPLDIYFYPILKNLGLQLRNRIIWHFGHGLHASKRFSGRYETLLWFTKSEEYTFNLDSVRIPSKYPGKKYFKGERKGQLSGNPLGKNPSDFWGRIEADFDAAIWEIPNVKANHVEKTEHPCQFPVELVERCVLAMTNPGDVVFDPYAGVASTLVAAEMHGRKGIGVDRDAQYVKIGRDRLSQLRRGELLTRPLGKAVHQPNGFESITQIPTAWRENGGAYAA